MMKICRISLPITFCLTLGLVLGCSGKTDSASASATNNSPAPAITVTTVMAQQRDLALTLKATGSVTPISSVDVKPQISSVITRVHFAEGQFVRAGQLLFTLDSRTDEANVAKARAQLVKDHATLADAQRQLVRSKQLLAQNFISQGAVDTNQSLVDSQAALVTADQAAIDAARVPLSYARITAPGAGRAGAVTVFAGSAVQANLTTLVTITQLDPIAVSFNLPQSNLGDVLSALNGEGTSVAVTIPNGGGTLTGKLQFVDNAVDAASGTVKVKAVFANPAGKLWPGAFVDVALNARTIKDAVVIPQAAIIQSARGSIVYALEAGKAVLRPVKLLYAQGEEAAVSGIRAGEAIVLDGRQNLRPGVSIVERPKEAAKTVRESAPKAPVTDAAGQPQPKTP
ncbi:MAG: efflux RND transporter periplasmic adaptor subunit [Burkholderiaceae bacterium]|nr:efflux RND transporter periplasmic adaptor subunit [Burkholderiaceae bacterium]